MGFLVLLFLAFIIYRSLNKTNGNSYAIQDQITIIKKQCPPHQWFWQEIKDQHGEAQGHRIVCKICGPLSKSLDGSVE